MWRFRLELRYSRAQEIQKELATLPQESHPAVSPRNEQNVASALFAFNSFSTSTPTTTKVSRPGWLQTIKEFFLGRKQ